ncbi:MAG: hypothetical protein ACE5EO_09620 [Candidatus Krumholzibacteriia bacterium]
MVAEKHGNQSSRIGNTGERQGRESDTGESARWSERKERVLHTRIPEALDEEIKAQARQLGVSVSNLVRNILKNTLGLVGDVVEDTANLTSRALGGAPEATQPGAERPTHALRPSAVVGWQQITLNVNAVCANCNAILEKGSDAAAAVGGNPVAPDLICPPCLENIRKH